MRARKKEIQKLKAEKLKKQVRLEIEKIDRDIEKVKAEKAKYSWSEENKVLVQICRTLISHDGVYYDDYYKKAANSTWAVLISLAKKKGKGPLKLAILTLIEELGCSIEEFSQPDWLNEFNITREDLIDSGLIP